MNNVNLDQDTIRNCNLLLQNDAKARSDKEWNISNPKGKHAIAVGLDDFINVKIYGSVGYYCGGMNQKATITVHGSAGPGVAENMMSGRVEILGDASQYAGATGNGGLLVIRGNASSRCGISIKGINIVIEKNVGHMSGFMAQSGNIIILGDAGHTLGDSIYEANIFVLGSVKSLGADCIEKEMRDEHHQLLRKIFSECEISVAPENLKRFGSARKLYNFKIDNDDQH